MNKREARRLAYRIAANEVFIAWMDGQHIAETDANTKRVQDALGAIWRMLERRTGRDTTAMCPEEA